MQFQAKRVNLHYDQAELEHILRYAKAHDVEQNGRYDILRLPPLLNIWTHAWSNAGCKAESCVMFSLEVDWKAATLLFVVLMPGFDWEAFARIIQECREFLPPLEHLSCCKESNLSAPERGEDDYTV